MFFDIKDTKQSVLKTEIGEVCPNLNNKIDI